MGRIFENGVWVDFSKSKALHPPPEKARDGLSLVSGEDLMGLVTFKNTFEAYHLPPKPLSFNEWAEVCLTFRELWDYGVFLEALAKSWTPMELFGYHETARGVLFLVAGREVREISPHEMEFGPSFRDDHKLTLRRRNMPEGTRLIWETFHEN